MKILIVEDEYLLASELEYFFQNAGMTVLGPASSVAAAYTYVDDADAALLDIQLADDLIFPIADRLVERNRPFVFASGHDEVIVPERFKHIAFLSKPINFDGLLQRLFIDKVATAAGKEAILRY